MRSCRSGLGAPQLRLRRLRLDMGHGGRGEDCAHDLVPWQYTCDKDRDASYATRHFARRTRADHVRLRQSAATHTMRVQLFAFQFISYYSLSTPMIPVTMTACEHA